MAGPDIIEGSEASPRMAGNTQTEVPVDNASEPGDSQSKLKLSTRARPANEGGVGGL